MPARRRGAPDGLAPAVRLKPPRDSVTGFGTTLASGGDILLVGGRMAELHPFAALYRLTPDGMRRERVLKGPQGHEGPSVATDGTRIAIGQPALAGGVGFVSIYRVHADGMKLEVTLEGKPDNPTCSELGERVAIGNDLLVLGQAASVCVYRHSAVGWLSAGLLTPQMSYAWNPMFGHAIGVARGYVLVGNPVEVSGYRAGPGRAFVYRQEGDHMQLESVLSGDGIEFGREQERRLGFGASIHVADDLVVITAPYELTKEGAVQSRLYVYRAQAGGMKLMTSVIVPSCQYGACLVGDHLIALGDDLHVLVRRGNTFDELASYAVGDASERTITACGRLLAMGHPSCAGEVTLHFATQL